jgi:hypothetical protein
VNTMAPTFVMCPISVAVPVPLNETVVWPVIATLPDRLARKGGLRLRCECCVGAHDHGGDGKYCCGQWADSPDHFSFALTQDSRSRDSRTLAR